MYCNKLRDQQEPILLIDQVVSLIGAHCPFQYKLNKDNFNLYTGRNYIFLFASYRKNIYIFTSNLHTCHVLL